MRFATRNLFYLRVSSDTVLPLYLYLDEKHVDWMSDRVLQHVLADLRNRIPEKLTNEADARLGSGGPANAKKGTLDVHRGDTYQFGYFLRNTEAHAVVIKSRRFVPTPRQPRLAPSKPASIELPQAETLRRAPQKRSKDSTSASKNRKTTNKNRAVISGSNEKHIDISSDEEQRDDTGTLTPVPLRRSSRVRKVVAGAYNEDEEHAEPILSNNDVEMVDDEDDQLSIIEDPSTSFSTDVGRSLITMDTDDDPVLTTATDVKTEESDVQLHPKYTNSLEVSQDNTMPGDNATIPLELDEGEEKPKLIPKLQYQGFNIHGKCLCVIVEPYPPIRATRAVSLVPTGVVAPRAPSIAPSDYVPPSVAAQRRARTPLFLPDDDRDRSVTPAPGGHEERILPPVPLFSDAAEEDRTTFNDDGMFELSQILQSVSGHPAGAAEDDDEIDGAALFGDADEVRTL